MFPYCHYVYINSLFCLLSDPFELQISSGCRLHAGQASESFLNGAYQGSDLLSFQGSSWEPSPKAGSRGQKVCRVLNLYEDIKEIVQSLLSDTCPRFLAGVLAAGKSELERQGESDPPSPPIPIAFTPVFEVVLSHHLVETCNKRSQGEVSGYRIDFQRKYESKLSDKLWKKWLLKLLRHPIPELLLTVLTKPPFLPTIFLCSKA